MSPGPAKSQAEEQAAATAKPAVYGPELPPSTIRDVRLPDQTQALHRDQEFRVHSAHGYYVFLSPSSPDAPRLRYGAEISKVSQLVKMSDDPLLFTGIADFSKFSPEKLPKIVGADAQAKALLTLLRSVSPEDRPGLYARFCATTNVTLTIGRQRKTNDPSRNPIRASLRIPIFRKWSARSLGS